MSAAEGRTANRVQVPEVDPGQRDCACALCKELCGLPGTPEELAAEVWNQIEQFYRRDVRHKPGLVRFLSILKMEGVWMYVATATDRPLAEAALKTAGIEVKRGKHLAFKIPGGKKFVRCLSLGEDYSEAAILERISGKRIVPPKAERTAPNLLLDIQAKMQQARSPGYERWASVFNLKEMAKTLNFLQEHGLLAYGDLESACDVAVQKYREFADRTKANSERMKEIDEGNR